MTGHVQVAPLVIGQLFERWTPMVLMYTVTSISVLLVPLTYVKVRPVPRVVSCVSCVSCVVSCDGCVTGVGGQVKLALQHGERPGLEEEEAALKARRLNIGTPPQTTQA